MGNARRRGKIKRPVARDSFRAGSPTVVYRYFQKLEHANALLAGIVRLGTLDDYRRSEDCERGDPNEGVSVYPATFGAHGGDEYTQILQERIGFKIGEGSRDIAVVGHRTIDIMPNAWVMCASWEDNPIAMREFGEHCVSIQAPMSFVSRMARSISKMRALRGADCSLVRYANANYAMFESPPGPLGYVKDPTRFSHQKEYRMIWYPAAGEPISTQYFECPEIRDLVRRVR
jgi:hypothetical protein